MDIFDLHCDTLSLISQGKKTVEESKKHLIKSGVKAQCFAAVAIPRKMSFYIK